MFLGVLLPSLFGAFTALSFAEPTDSYLDDLVTASPAWYVLPIVVISLLGGLSQGVLCVYASGLDLEGLAPRLKRTQTTIITAAVAIALLYLGVFVFDAVESVTAMTVALNAVITPWVVDPGNRRAAHQDLRPGRPAGVRGGPPRRPLLVHRRLERACGHRRGRSARAFGLLTVNTTLYVGPLADIAGGVDLSTIGSAALAGLIYACASCRRADAKARVAAAFGDFSVCSAED